jgi:hypothetical protein
VLELLVAAERDVGWSFEKGRRWFHEKTRIKDNSQARCWWLCL